MGARCVIGQAKGACVIAQQLAGGVAVKGVIREGSLATKTKAFASLDSAKEPFTGGFAAETFPNADEKPVFWSLRLVMGCGSF